MEGKGEEIGKGRSSMGKEVGRVEKGRYRQGGTKKLKEERTEKQKSNKREPLG